MTRLSPYLVANSRSTSLRSRRMTSQITKLGMGLGLILLSCTGSADATVCDDSPISLELPSIDSDVVLFGELHGNRESPEVFLAAICQYLLSEDRKVRVALEFPTEMQQSLEIFMESDGDRDAVLQFLSQPFWQENRGDGRSSVAMLTLVDQLRQTANPESKIGVGNCGRRLVDESTNPVFRH